VIGGELLKLETHSDTPSNWVAPSNSRYAAITQPGIAAHPPNQTQCFVTQWATIASRVPSANYGFYAPPSSFSTRSARHSDMSRQPGASTTDELTLASSSVSGRDASSYAHCAGWQTLRICFAEASPDGTQLEPAAQTG
jgi:hypothetical protein